MALFDWQRPDAGPEDMFVALEIVLEGQGGSHGRGQDQWGYRL
jgi:hypothetical protein